MKCQFPPSAINTLFCLINFSMNFSLYEASEMGKPAKKMKCMCKAKIHKTCVYVTMARQPTGGNKYGKSTYFSHLRAIAFRTMFSTQLNTNGYRQNGFKLGVRTRETRVCFRCSSGASIAFCPRFTCPAKGGERNEAINVRRIAAKRKTTCFALPI